MRNPPTTVEDFITEVTNIERALLARASRYERLHGVSAVQESSCNYGASIPGIRELIRDVVREELQRLLPAAKRSTSLSVAEVVREEV